MSIHFKHDVVTAHLYFCTFCVQLIMLFFSDLDGCPDEEAAGYSWPETDLGMVAMVSCICGNIDTAEISRVAIRECGGSFAEGAAWVEPDISECQFSGASRLLCDASTVSLNPIFDALYAQLSMTVYCP